MTQTGITALTANPRQLRQTAHVREADEVFRQLAGPVHNYLRAAGSRDADDLLGDVFVAVLRGLHRFRGDDRALRRWIFTIAHNRLVDERRRSARQRRLLRRQPVMAVSPPEDPFDPALVAALHSLTPEQREVVVLRFVADLPLESVATITKRSVTAVKALQRRALCNLTRALERGTQKLVSNRQY